MVEYRCPIARTLVVVLSVEDPRGFRPELKLLQEPERDREAEEDEDARRHRGLNVLQGRRDTRVSCCDHNTYGSDQCWCA